MSKVEDIGYVAVRKYRRLADEHGHDHAVATMGQREIDIGFEYIVACATPENYDKAVELGYPPGTHVILATLGR